MNLLDWIIVGTVEADILDYVGESLNLLDWIILGTVEADILYYVGETIGSSRLDNIRNCWSRCSRLSRGNIWIF